MKAVIYMHMYTYHLIFFSLAAAGMTVGDFIAELDTPIPALESAKPWVPKLNVGGDSDGNITTALQVSLKTGGI